MTGALAGELLDRQAKSIAPMKLFSVGSGVSELPSIFTITLSATSVM